MDTNVNREAMRRPARNGDEQDAFGRGHTRLTWRAGERTAVKARHARAARRNVRAELRDYR